MQNNKIDCGLCDESKTYGPHIYDLVRVERYGLMVCRSCFAANWDGWSPQYEPRLLKSLKDNKLQVPPRLSNRLFPRT